MNLELPGPATRSGWLLRRGAWASASACNYRHDRGAMTVLSEVERYTVFSEVESIFTRISALSEVERYMVSSEVESLCLRTYKRVFMGGGLKSSSLYGSTSSGLCVWCQFRPTSWVMTRSAELLVDNIRNRTIFGKSKLLIPAEYRYRS